MTTYEEWRITGSDEYGGRLADVLFTSTEDGDAEARARSFADWARAKHWTDGPHLHKRTVTVTDWEEV